MDKRGGSTEVVGVGVRLGVAVGVYVGEGAPWVTTTDWTLLQSLSPTPSEAFTR
jgi:hypothetical protein